MKDNHIVIIDKNRCTGCGLCVKDCTLRNILISDRKAAIIEEKCLACGHCVAICPANAVSITDFEDIPEELASLPKVTGDALLAHVRSRRSIRQFEQHEIPADTVSKIIAAGQYTPSASNKQNVSYVVLQKDIAVYEQQAVAVLRKLKRMIDIFSKKWRHFEIDDHFFFKNAPIAIVIKSDNTVDAALAASSMELTAQAYGIGVLYSGFFTITIKIARSLRKRLGFSGGEKPVATLVLGYPAVTYRRTAPKERPNILYR